MTLSIDSKLYCAKCKKHSTCNILCYPVERLLESVTVPLTEKPTDLTDCIESSPNEAFNPPESWVLKSNKRKVFELCFVDKHTQQYAANMIGVTRQRVNQIAIEILRLVDNL